ncbi:MAG TPA: isochorismatase family protein, partial [Sporichthyaceae bacterium]|nr:isochorismatase family protein [Sporichthyaceae bacterium]
MAFTVDVHHHILPDFFFRATNEGDQPVGGIALPPWSRASMLSFLDDAGIDVAITSISTPGVHTGDDTAARALARRCNELAAVVIRDRPDRFGGFACLPLPDADGALAELAYAFDDLRLDGVVLFSNAHGTYLGDPRCTAAETFRRLYWDSAASRGDPVLRMLRDVVGLDRVLFGTDYPYLRRDLAVSCREHIEASPELTDGERAAVLGATAATLIPRLASLRVIKAFGLPVVHSTVNVAAGQGPTLPELAGLLAEDKPLDRTTVNSWEDVEFLQAVRATGRRKLIICALWTEVCMAFTALDALRDGYEVYPVVDAIAGTSPEAHRAGLERVV